MRTVLRVGASLALGMTIVPAFLVFFGVISWQTHAGLMTAGMVLWFATASWYRKSPTG
jgi:hypothetical protein